MLPKIEGDPVVLKAVYEYSGHGQICLTACSQDRTCGENQQNNILCSLMIGCSTMELNLWKDCDLQSQKWDVIS